jgi:hypothetical protein
MRIRRDSPWLAFMAAIVAFLAIIGFSAYLEWLVRWLAAL